MGRLLPSMTLSIPLSLPNQQPLRSTTLRQERPRLRELHLAMGPGLEPVFSDSRVDPAYLIRGRREGNRLPNTNPADPS